MSRPARPRMLVTGASAGIGQALARVYAEAGWDLVLTARRREPMQALAEALLQRHGTSVEVMAFDLADPDAPQALVESLSRQRLRIDGLCNNAGFSRVTGFLDTPPDQHEAMIQVMLTAPMALARRLLPAMVEARFGRVVNVASLAGFTPFTGGDTLYGPIKSFLIKASQGLRQEVAGTGVHVTALCPGYTYSEFHDVNGSRDQVSRAYSSAMWMTAEDVALAAYGACEANRPVEIPGWRNRVAAGLLKILPDGLVSHMTARHARRLGRL